MMASYYYETDTVTINDPSGVTIKTSDEILFDLQIINNNTENDILVYIFDKTYNADSYMRIKAGGYIDFEKSVPKNQIIVRGTVGDKVSFQKVK